MERDLLVTFVKAVIANGDPVPLDMIFSLCSEGCDYSEIEKLIEEANEDSIVSEGLSNVGKGSNA